MDELPWLTLSEAAERTGLSRETIRSRVRRGLLPFRRNNRGELVVQVVQVPVQVPAFEHAAPAADDTELTTLRETVADLSAEVADLRVALARAEAEAPARERYIALLEEMLRDARQPFWRRWWR